MYRAIVFIFAMLSFTFLLHSAHAQDQFRRPEVFFAAGNHAPLNELVDLGLRARNKLYLAGHLLYNFSETQSIGVRFGRTAHPVIEWFVTYRHSWRKRQPLRIYFGVGLGASEALYGGDMRYSLAFAVGIKRFLGQHWSLSLESRGVGFTQGENEFAEETVVINELTIVLGYMF